MTGAETAGASMERMSNDETPGMAMKGADPAPVSSVSPLRRRFEQKVAYLRSLRELTDEQEDVLAFCEEYMRRDPAVLAQPREVQQDVSEPLQRR